MACVVAAPAAGQEPGATLPSRCQNQKVAPAQVILTCGDGALIAKQLVWRDWGQERAHATGVLSANLCEPSCAEGTREEFPVELTAERLRYCDYGKPQYTRLSLSFPAASPPYPPEPVTFRCPIRPHPNPKITKMRMWMTGHGAPGPRYFVRVHIWTRVCAVRGRSEVNFYERQLVGGDIFGEFTRNIGFRQRPHCQDHSFRWRLRDEFFGVGTYRVAATVYDKDGQSSKTVSRRIVTRD
jgi:hypothetical protein